MSQAFDSLNQNKLLNDLGNTITPDELHIGSKLLQVSLSVKVDNVLSQEFQTDTGAPQYLAKALEPVNNKNQLPDHPYAPHQITTTVNDHLSEHNYVLIPQTDQLGIARICRRQT